MVWCVAAQEWTSAPRRERSSLYFSPALYCGGTNPYRLATRPGEKYRLAATFVGSPAALARAEAERDAVDAQLEQLTADRESLKEAFAAISSDQLEANRDELLKQAGECFEPRNATSTNSKNATNRSKPCSRGWERASSSRTRSSFAHRPFST
jgi:hypothetical protein